MSFIRNEILRLVVTGRLEEPFSPEMVRRVSPLLRDNTSLGTFLPKHRVGNPRGETELFIREPDIWGGGYRVIRN